MSSVRHRDLSVGAFAVLALIVLSVGIMAVGGESRFFSRKVRYRAVFPSTDGLIVGSPVKMAGVQVGTVSAIRLPTDPGAEGIEVVVGVDQQFAARVRNGSRAGLRFLQYLSGEKYVEITPGPSTEPPLPAGAVVPSAPETRLLEQGQDIADNLNEITIALKEILGPLRRGEGLLGQMIQDPNFGKEGLEALRGALENVQDLTARLQRGEGFAGKLLTDPGLEHGATDLAKAIRDLATFMERLNNNEGALGQLMRREGSAGRAVDDLAAAAASLRRLAERLESGKGLLGRLLNDEEYSEKLAADLGATAGNLHEITRKINSGQGTLGALVNERVLHDGLEEVVAGVGDSKFANWLLRHYQKKGIEATVVPETPAEAP